MITDMVAVILLVLGMTMVIVMSDTMLMLDIDLISCA